MNEAALNVAENPSNIIRKTSLFLRDDSYRIIYLAKNTIVHNDQRTNPIRKDLMINKRDLYRARKHQTLIDMESNRQLNSNRRENHFILACGTVILALTILIVIMIYAIIMTVNHFQIQLQEFPSWNHPSDR